MCIADVFFLTVACLLTLFIVFLGIQCFFLSGSVVSNPPAMKEPQETLVSVPGSDRYPGGGHGNPLQYSCLENPHGQRSLVGYSPWGRKKLDTTEVTQHAHIHCVLWCTQFVYFHIDKCINILLYGLYFFKLLLFKKASCISKILRILLYSFILS